MRLEYGSALIGVSWLAGNATHMFDRSGGKRFKQLRSGGRQFAREDAERKRQRCTSSAETLSTRLKALRQKAHSLPPVELQTRADQLRKDIFKSKHVQSKTVANKTLKVTTKQQNKQVRLCAALLSWNSHQLKKAILATATSFGSGKQHIFIDGNIEDEAEMKVTRGRKRTRTQSKAGAVSQGASADSAGAEANQLVAIPTDAGIVATLAESTQERKRARKSKVMESRSPWAAVLETVDGERIRVVGRCFNPVQIVDRTTAECVLACDEARKTDNLEESTSAFKTVRRCSTLDGAGSNDRKERALIKSRKIINNRWEKQNVRCRVHTQKNNHCKSIKPVEDIRTLQLNYALTLNFSNNLEDFGDLTPYIRDTPCFCLWGSPRGSGI